MTLRDDNNSAWAAEMQRAQAEALPTAVRSGNGVFLVAGSADADLIDADPAPGVQPRWIGNARKGNVMGKVADRQMSEPTITVPLDGQAVKAQGTFAGPSSGAFSICHLSGNKFWIQGGDLEFNRLAGVNEDDTLIYETKRFAIESRSIFVDQTRTTIIGFECQYAKQEQGDWDLNLQFATRVVSAEDTVQTGPVCGMLVALSGSPIVLESFTPVGDSFLPWIALHTAVGDLDWKQSIGMFPTAFIDPSLGFFWWP